MQDEDEDEDEVGTPDWILRAADRLAATIVSERMSTEEAAVGETASSTGPGRRRRRRQKRATLLRWLRWIAALSFSSLLLVLAIGMLRPMAGPAVRSGVGSQLALLGATDPEACDATGTLSTLQAAMQGSSELLRDAMWRGDSAAHAAAKAQVRVPVAPCPLPAAGWRGGSVALSVCTGSSPWSDTTPTRHLTRGRRGLRPRSGGGVRLRSCCG